MDATLWEVNSAAVVWMMVAFSLILFHRIRLRTGSRVLFWVMCGSLAFDAVYLS